MSLTNLPLFSVSVRADLLSLEKDEKCSLINAFWPHLDLASEDYIEKEYLDLFHSIGTALENLRQHKSIFAIQNVDQLLYIVRKLQTNQSSRRHALIEMIKKDFLSTPNDDIVRSIELVARLWVGINIASRNVAVGPRNPQESRIEWQETVSLEELAASRFPYKTSWIVGDELPLDESLTAVSLKRICRLHIRWTDNLADHLRLKGSRGNRNLSIYRHKICLVNHARGSNPVINASILKEAIRTLDLLFPFGDPETANFLEAEGIYFYSIYHAEVPAPTDFSEFKYWRNNLAQLLKLLNGPPESVIQTLLDTRNVAQFATLWIAIFGVFALTTFFGILATVYAIKQYQVALLSYELALALACQEPQTPPGFCDPR